MNFSTKLFNQLLSKDSDNEDINEDNTCLITGESLIPKRNVILPCNHSFNYMPLFNEIKKQKHYLLPKSKYTLETQRLKTNQIKCPYCRKVFNGILPPSNNAPMILYVNFPDKYILPSLLTDSCKYKFRSGKRKNLLCGLKCYGEFCHCHKKRGLAYKNKIQNLPIITKLSNKNKGSCCHCLTGGKRKGEWCGKSALYSIGDSKYCKTHASKYGKWPDVITI